MPAIPLEDDSESDAEEGSPQAADVVRQMQERRAASRAPPLFKELAVMQAMKLAELRAHAATVGVWINPIASLGNKRLNVFGDLV